MDRDRSPGSADKVDGLVLAALNSGISWLNIPLVSK
jgi:hypothetical protein